MADLVLAAVTLVVMAIIVSLLTIAVSEAQIQERIERALHQKQAALIVPLPPKRPAQWR